MIKQARWVTRNDEAYCKGDHPGDIIDYISVWHVGVKPTFEERRFNSILCKVYIHTNTNSCLSIPIADYKELFGYLPAYESCELKCFYTVKEKETPKKKINRYELLDFK